MIKLISKFQQMTDEQIMFQINNVAYKNNNNFLNHV